MFALKQPAPDRYRALFGCLCLFLLTAVFVAPAVQAQPFGAWITSSNASAGDYIQIPHSPALNPTGALTVEAWVLNSNADCSSLVGKGFDSAWWLGHCAGLLRSYVRGGSSQRNAGVIPFGKWTHVAVVFDGSQRRHYINGEQRGVWDEPMPLTTNSQPVRISSDVDWFVRPNGAIDEVRIWNVARTKAQLREWINQRIVAPQPGLVAVWGLDGGANAAVGPHNGVIVGSPGFLTFPVTLDCNPSTATTLCLDDRFAVRAEWRKPDGTEGNAMTAPCGTDDSGLLWFFNPNNWEILVKTLNGCGFPSPHYWVFAASTTNVFYRLEVLDVQAGAQKIYFNYPGPPAPAITDTAAFATCP